MQYTLDGLIRMPASAHSGYLGIILATNYLGSPGAGTVDSQIILRETRSYLRPQSPVES